MEKPTLPSSICPPPDLYILERVKIPSDIFHLLASLVSSVTPPADCVVPVESYDGFNALYDVYHTQGLEILAFPCNQFLNQMGDMDMCTADFHATFPHFAEVKVRETILIIPVS